MPNSLRARLKNLVHKGILTQKDLDRIVIVPVDCNGDLISRQDAINAICAGSLSAATAYGRTDKGMAALKETVKLIKELPSVTPAPKRGRWEDCSSGWMCSECGTTKIHESKYCPGCGAKMVEPQESEVI